jgi:hypothetical protein
MTKKTLSVSFREYLDIELNKIDERFNINSRAFKRLEKKLEGNIAKLENDMDKNSGAFKGLKKKLENDMDKNSGAFKLNKKLEDKIKKLENNFTKLEDNFLQLEEQIKSLKSNKGNRGLRGIQGKQGPKGEVGATGIQGESGPKGERGPKGEPGSGSVDADIITGINSKISSLENAVLLNQKRPSSSSNNNNINYYLNRNYEDTQSIFTELSGIYGRLAASEESISSTYNTDSNLDLLSLITALTGRVEALEA